MPETKFIASAVAQNHGEHYATPMQAGQFELLADEPVDVGGKGLAPTPGDYLCMALASCKAITLRMYVERKQWKVDDISVKVSLGKDEASGNHTFISEVAASGNLSDEQRQRLLHISKICPVSKLLAQGSEIVERLG